MKKIAVGLLFAFATGVAAQGLVTSLSMRKSLPLKFKAGDALAISVNGAEFITYTVPDGKTFQGSLNFNGTEQ